MKTGWQQKTLPNKIVSISVIVVSAAILVLAAMQLFGLWNDAGYAYVPLTGINLLLQAYIQWKPNRKTAVFILAAAILVLLCAAAVYIVR